MFRFLRFAAAVVLLAGLALHAGRTSSADAGDAVSVIVELKGEPAAVRAARERRAGAQPSAADVQSYRTQLLAQQDDFLRALSADGVNYTLRSRSIKNYDGSTAASVDLRYTLVYNGFALVVPRAAVAGIEAMPQVKDVHANSLLYTQLNKSVDYIGAPRLYGAVKELSQFDDLREGFEGQGINIAVIDTGIDWTHPMFGGDPTPPRLGVAPAVAAVNTNQKVIYNLPLTDSHVGDGFGHGTHVASTAAGYLAQHPGADGLPGTVDDIRLHGVAPQAKLMSYTVCSTTRSTPGSLGLPSVGGCESADTIMALEDAVSPFTITLQPKPVAHVINLSLGGSGGPDSATAVACSNAALAGATVVASSGNSGPGEGTTGAPAAGRHVISVGANTHPGAAGSVWSVDVLQASAVSPTRTGGVTPANNLPTASGFNRLKIFPMSGTAGLPAGAMAQRYVFVNNPTVTWPTAVSGRIALVKTSGLPVTPFAVIANMATASGAAGVLYYSAIEGATAVTGSVPAANIAPADGDALADAMLSNDNNAVDPPNGTISELPIRMNPTFSPDFMGEMAGFSSRGPVRGLGQIKPDISAPGVAVLAAVPPASVLGALAAATETTPNYIHLDGTSMSSPHTAGAVALIKQAHPDWTPDMIRTALINTATNMRNQSGAPKAEGLTADSIIAQGGGLIDTYEAAHAKALMGVAGDGVEAPAILGSHSYGEVPVINSRTTHTARVTVTVRDLSGQGGTYNLGVANNRDLQLAGISVNVSQPSVTLQPNGEATFSVDAAVDGDLLRSVMAQKTPTLIENIQMQWYVTAKRSDNAESLRMPFFFRPAPSLPAETQVETTTHTELLPAADAGNQAAAGVTYIDVPFEVSSSTFVVEATTEWFLLPAGDQPDLDYQLLNPAGVVIASSGVPGGPEFVRARVSQAGTYTHRVIGYTNGPTDFTITTALTKGGTPPTLSAIAGEFADASGDQIDFDGAYTLAWSAAGGARGFEIERSIDGGQTWALIATAAGDATGLALNGQPDGENAYRVRALIDGQIGSFVTPPSETASVTVSRRTREEITALVQTAISNVSFANGVFQLDQTLTNNSANSYVPHVEFKVVGITSASGTVAAANADNGGDGKSAATAALYDYSRRLGADELFAAGETTGARTLRFSDARAEMFSFDAVVTAYRGGAGGGAAAAAPAAGGGGAQGSASSDPLRGVTGLMRFTANPLTKTVSVRLVSL